MDQKILDYYAGMKVPIHKMVFVGQTRRGLSAAAIEAAAEQIYDEIQDGSRSGRSGWLGGLRQGPEGQDAGGREGAGRDDEAAGASRVARAAWYKRVFRRMK